METKHKAKTLTALLPDGRKVERKTVHAYQYVVAAQKPGAGWGALSWHHSYDNAMIQTQSNWAKIYTLRIVPVLENMGPVFCAS